MEAGNEMLIEEVEAGVTVGTGGVDGAVVSVVVVAATMNVWLAVTVAQLGSKQAFRTYEPGVKLEVLKPKVTVLLPEPLL